MDLFSYLQNGKTAYHSVAETASMLSGAAFNALNEHDVWDLKAGDGFFVQRNSSSLLHSKFLKIHKSKEQLWLPLTLTALHIN